MAAEKKYEIGDEILTECGKCKSEMVHIVTAMEGEKVKKVMCKGCNHTHVYRKKKKKVSETKTSTKAKPVRKRRVGRKDWGKLTADMPEEAFVEYNMAEDFTEKEGIRHSKFGNGVITKVLADNQIEVVFEESTKVLMQNYSRA